MGCENNCINEHRFTALQKELDTLKEKNSNDHEKFFNRIEEKQRKNGRIAKRQTKYQRKT